MDQRDLTVMASRNEAHIAGNHIAVTSMENKHSQLPDDLLAIIPPEARRCDSLMINLFHPLFY
jgi:hypothetical protein